MKNTDSNTNLNKQSNKIVISGLLLVTMLIAGYFVYQDSQFKQKVNQLFPEPKIKNKLNNKEKEISDNVEKNIKIPYVKGEVVVGFKKGTIYSEAKKTLESYNLQYKEPYKKRDLEKKKEIPFEPSDMIGEEPVSFVVYVPEGEEQQWIDILTKNDLIEYANFNHYVHTF